MSCTDYNTSSCQKIMVLCPRNPPLRQGDRRCNEDRGISWNGGTIHPWIRLYRIVSSRLLVKRGSVMSKRAVMLFCFFFIFLFGQASLAAEKAMRLRIPGCTAWDAKQRIGSVLEAVEGVYQFAISADGAVKITFDDAKTSVRNITEALGMGGFNIQGVPEFLPLEDSPGASPNP